MTKDERPVKVHVEEHLRSVDEGDAVFYVSILVSSEKGVLVAASMAENIPSDMRGTALALAAKAMASTLNELQGS